jgi:aspartate aminotransferase-like enzyme
MLEGSTVQKYRLLAPGPVAVPERVLLAMARPMVHHRAPEFLPILDEIRANLKRLFQTTQDVLLLASSGTGAMEAAVANVLSCGDRAVVVRGGKFGERWADICTAYGAEPICVDVEWGQAVDPSSVRKAFEENPEARALYVQASETSTGVYHPVRELAQVVREKEYRLIVVDAISGLGVHDIPMAEWNLDVVVSGSQKSFMLPPGLAFIALSNRAQAAIQRSKSPRYYFDLRKELETQPANQTAYTPAVSLLLGLRESLAMIFEEGLENVFRRHATLSRATRAAMTALGLELFAPDSPSHACTAVRVPEGVDGKALTQRLRDEYGLTIAGGQGRMAGKIFRVGHLGYVDRFDVLAAVAAIEMLLGEIGYPVKLGEGMRAASEILSEMPAKGA